MNDQLPTGHAPMPGADPSELGGVSRREAGRSLVIALGLALAVLALEIAGGLISNSLALFADAGHVAGDTAAVTLALGAIWLTGRPSGSQRTFGWYRAEIMAALVNGTALLVIAGVIAWQAIERIGDEPEIKGTELVAFAAVGLAANVISMIALHRTQQHNLNVRGAYYHVLGDALGSVGALVAGVVILASDWTPVDLIVSFGIAGLIVISGLRLVRETVNILLEAAPPGLDVDTIAAEICAVSGVLGVHDLHLWTVTSGFPALACHVEVDEQTDPEAILVPVIERLQERFSLLHVTVQPESPTLHHAMACCEFPDLTTLGRFSVGHREVTPHR